MYILHFLVCQRQLSINFDAKVFDPIWRALEAPHFGLVLMNFFKKDIELTSLKYRVSRIFVSTLFFIGSSKFRLAVLNFLILWLVFL